MSEPHMTHGCCFPTITENASIGSVFNAHSAISSETCLAIAAFAALVVRVGFGRCFERVE